MSDSVLRYVRGNKYIKIVPLVGDTNTKIVHALVGQVLVGGWSLDAIELMDGHISIEIDLIYRKSRMYWNKNYNFYVIDPCVRHKNNLSILGAIKNNNSESLYLNSGCIGLGF